MLSQESISDLRIYEMGVDLQTPICDGNVPCEINQVNLITNLTEEDCPDFTGICHSIKL
ncbi:hypothetical protein [Methanococcoides seepicolus]|uniref:Uncharacterized protein n=1 Tax=Methanococcoides seepicolus TaxID=2828780 RepID=A0A9E4ZF00_9EURY|nr:hypothetical protein [Methanococcoides seepicolus]MCM1986462.1 hypothetical protein [Methanococcoides seepicolus]